MEHQGCDFLQPATSDFEISRLARPEFEIFISLTKYVASLEQQVAKNHNIDGPIVKYWKHFFLDTINLPCTGSEERAEYKRKMFKVSRRAQVHTSIDV